MIFCIKQGDNRRRTQSKGKKVFTTCAKGGMINKQ